MNKFYQNNPRAAIDAYQTDISTLNFSNIMITKIGLAEKDPNQYFDYKEGERHDFCIQYVFDGEGSFWTNNTLYTVKKGDLFLIPRDKEHYYKANPDNPYTYYWIHFNGSGFENFLKLIGLSDENPVIHNLYDENIVSIFQKLVETSKTKTSASQLITLSLGYELLYKFASEIPLQEQNYTTPQEQTCSEITNFIIEHYTQNLSLDDISTHFAMDKYNMIKLYKNVTGFTPINFLVNYRIENACKLLKQGRSVNEAAYSCGFNDLPNFSVRFKKIIGVSPSEFKAENMEKGNNSLNKSKTE